jgi:hypothetical protein
MVQYLSGKVDHSSAGTQMPFLWNLKVSYSVYESPHLGPIINQVNSVYILVSWGHTVAKQSRSYATSQKVVG